MSKIHELRQELAAKLKEAGLIAGELAKQQDPIALAAKNNILGLLGRINPAHSKELNKSIQELLTGRTGKGFKPRESRFSNTPPALRGLEGAPDPLIIGQQKDPAVVQENEEVENAARVGDVKIEPSENIEARKELFKTTAAEELNTAYSAAELKQLAKDFDIEIPQGTRTKNAIIARIKTVLNQPEATES